MKTAIMTSDSPQLEALLNKFGLTGNQVQRVRIQLQRHLAVLQWMPVDASTWNVQPLDVDEVGLHALLQFFPSPVRSLDLTITGGDIIITAVQLETVETLLNAISATFKKVE